MSTSLERARRLVEEVGEASSPEGYAKIVVDGIWDLFPNDETTFMETDRATGRILVERWRTVIPPSLSEDRFAHEDMPFCPDIADGESVVVRMSDVIGRRDLERLPVYRELMEPLGERYVVWAQFEQRPDVYRCVGFARADRDITDAELDLMILLTPHLDLAYRRARARSKVTPREWQVVVLVGQGMTNQEIALRLGVSPGTIRSHLEHVFAKLGVGTRTAAVAALR
jgi:DNA-binding NarL/FixJ family response regulator